MESIMARIKINDIESASFASESYLNDLQELEMTSVKGGWWPPTTPVHIIIAQLRAMWYHPYASGVLHETA
jgi:hypothetical protein